jgi:hypothetical protein
MQSLLHDPVAALENISESESESDENISNVKDALKESDASSNDSGSEEEDSNSDDEDRAKENRPMKRDEDKDLKKVSIPSVHFGVLF